MKKDVRCCWVCVVGEVFRGSLVRVYSYKIPVVARMIIGAIGLVALKISRQPTQSVHSCSQVISLELHQYMYGITQLQLVIV